MDITDSQNNSYVASLFDWRLTLRIFLPSVLVLCFLALCPTRLAASENTFALSDSQQSVDLWPSVTLLEDPANEFDLETVLHRSDDFQPPDSPYANLGIRSGVVWLQLRLRVPDGSKAQWLFDLDYPSIDRLEIFLLESGQLIDTVSLGDHLRLEQRPLPTRSHAAPLHLQAGKLYQMILRVQTSSTMVLPISLKQPKHYYQQESNVLLLQGIFAGVWLCLCLYSLTQWINLRDAMFAYYPIAIIGTGLFFASYFGVGASHVWSGSSWMTQNMAPLSILIGVVGGLLFVDRALRVGDLNRQVSRAAHLMAGFAAAAAFALVSGLLSYQSAQLIATAVGLSPMLVAVPAAYVRWRGGDKASAYMLWGWLIFALGATHQALMLRGVLGATYSAQHVFQVGSLVEMLLWMMVLGARVDEMRQKAEHAHYERDLLHALANTDPLTGLLNRRGLEQAAQDPLRQAQAQALTAVFLIDLDGFKPINDTLGHDAGDALLRQVGARLTRQVRRDDLVARIGGDEFVVIVPNLPSQQQAASVGAKLLQSCQRPFEVVNQTCAIGLTIGYAIAPLDGKDLGSLLKSADAALYDGKESGKNCVQRGRALSDPLPA